MIKPPRIRKGDTIGVVAPASAPPDPGAIDRGIETLEKLGFRVRLAANARKRWGYLAGSDAERASDLTDMFKDPEIRAILCVRGGYGCARLLPMLDYDLIRRNPKVFVGYSDVTSLHLAMLKETGLITFHGPMLNPDFAKADMPEFTLERLFAAVCTAEPPGSIRQGYDAPAPVTHFQGKAEGILVGGNLSLLCASVGTPWQLSVENSILFFEDVDEKPYRFDRMLTQLLSAGLLQRAAGIAVGINKECEELARAGEGVGEYRQSLEDVLKERLLPLKVPLVSGLPFGHVRKIATLPIGARALLDADKGDLVLTDSVVS